MHKNKLIILSAALICAAGLVSCKEQQPAPDTSQESSNTADTTSPQPVSDDGGQPFDASGMHFSAQSGFYDDAFLLTVTAEDGAEIYYTLDGSDPTPQSQHYTDPIAINDRSSEPDVLAKHTDITVPHPADTPKKPVDKATVVRFISIDGNGNQSEVVTNTYFVGFGAKSESYQNLKIISLITDEQNLFDPETGIYVAGKVYDDWKNGEDYDPETPDYQMPANYTQKGKDWERPAEIQIFENGALGISQNVGIRIHGGATRSYAQKSFNIYARSEYGEAKLNYDLFSGAVKSEADGSTVTEFDRFMLRNGGNDAMFARYRDHLNQSLVADRAFLTQCMEPCIVFLNGEYWGQYDITESVDVSTIKAHYGVPKKDICIIKKEELEKGTDADFAEWEALREQIRETDYSDPEAYTQLCEAVDMQSFMDYVSAELYIDNANWDSSNTAMWKAVVTDESNPYADGKWRFIMFDTDYSTGIYGEAVPSDESLTKLMDTDCFLSELLHAALKNDTFKEQFRKTFAEIAEQNFGESTVNARIDALSEQYHDISVNTFQRFWNGWFDPAYQFESETKIIRNFYEERNKYITEDFESQIPS